MFLRMVGVHAEHATDCATLKTKRWYLKDEQTITNEIPKGLKLASGRAEKGNSLVLTINSQIRGGKNNVQITRTGHRYPNPTFAKWRDEAVDQIVEQSWNLAQNFPLKLKYEAIIDYTPGDLKVRDVPAMMDALWSVLVKAGVLADDGLIREVVWREHPLDRTTPMVRIELRKL